MDSQAATPSQNIPDARGAEWSVRRFKGRPSEQGLDALLQLAVAAEEADGHPPFNEQTTVELRSGDDPDALLGVAAVRSAGPEHDDFSLAGAAVVTAHHGEPAVVELVVRPDDRGSGVGTALAAELEDLLAGREVQAWSHGDHPAAARLAEQHGLGTVRSLWRMRQCGAPATAAAPLPDGVRLRSFVVGQDEEAWLRVNAAAFAHHPEQGRMSLHDLQERERSDWFDPKGFLLAVDEEDTVLGFHWTKVHPAHRDERGREAGPIGEVYAVGIAPEAQGRGLGRALTAAGINHLSGAGLGTIMLYVEADNAPAVGLYRSLGFTRWDGDVMYGRGAATTSP